MRRRDASVSGRGDGVGVAPDAIDASPNARQTVYGRESSHTGFGFVMSFLFVFIVRGLGGAATLCGLALFVECAVEVPVMRAADGLLARHGSKTLVVVVLLLYAARCAGCALLTAPGRPGSCSSSSLYTGSLLFYGGRGGARRACRRTGDARSGPLLGGLQRGAGVGAALGGLGVRRMGQNRTSSSAGFVATVAAFVKLVDDSRRGRKSVAAAARPGTRRKGTPFGGRLCS